MKTKSYNDKLKLRIFMLILGFIALIATFLFVSITGLKEVFIDTELEVFQYYNSKSDDVLYLSDIDYLKDQSFAKYDEIRYDKVDNGSKITLKIENNGFSFDKGIWAHANSQVTYDISRYNYKYFTAFIGLNTTSNRGDGVRFYIFTSEDGTNWGEAKYDEVKLPGAEASFVKIELENAKYLRLVADQISGNASDHSVYADAKLTNNTKITSIFKTPEEYDEIIQSLYHNQNDLIGEIEFNLLKRQLVKNVGTFTINSFYHASEDNQLLLDWLMNNQTALRYYILGGKPNGSYYKSLTEFSRLYRNYKNDFNNTGVTKYGTVLGDLYLRMATSLSLTHSGLVGLWMNNASTPENQSDSVRRYAIIKYMHKNNLFEGPDSMDYNSWFEKYTVEEMRYVMANSIDDQSMLWLNAYVRELIKKEGSSRLWPHKYIAYVWPNYANPVYYAEENKDYFNQLFSVLDEEHEGQRIGLWDVVYTIPGGVDEPEYTLQIPRGTSDNKIYKVWMNMRNKFGTGAVCGGISKVGANIRGVLGLPDAVVGQPGHAAHINYFKNSKGEGFWGIDNDVSGWAYTGSSGLLGWANGPYASGYTGTYIPLAQEVVNHFDIYEQSQRFVYLSDSYTDLAKKEELYRKALEIQPLNLNAWYGLILTYHASENKTEEQYFELAKEIAENLKYYPLPMYQMTNQIKSKLTSTGESYKFILLQTRILKEASNTPNNSTEVLQPNITRLMANFLLGQMDTTIATFSFDGEDAGKIVLSNRFDGNGVRWDYSIHGKDQSNFKEVSFSADEEHKWQLTKEEIAALNSENDLYIHIVGVNYSDENLYKIDIQESAGLPATTFASDLENELLGVVGAVEWKYREEDEWTRYDVARPLLIGDKSIIVRMGATGTYLASNHNTTFTFTEDRIDETRKYIPISHLSLHEVSTEATSNQGNAIYALDANYNTRWHSAWNGSDTKRFITVKFDQPYNISAVEFVPAAGGNGKIYDGTIWGSLDGENWIVINQQKGLTYTNAATTVEEAIQNIKSFDMDTPQRVQYIKIVADRTNGNWAAARAFNFYEDTTAKIIANFSFDNENTGKIELVDSEYNKNWQYSIDGGKNWIHASGHNHILSTQEVSLMSAENGIKIKLSDDDTIYSIELKNAPILELNPFVNDLENRLIGIDDVSSLEWKFKDSDKWISYAEEEPIVEGNKTLQVRTKAVGITLPSEPVDFEFTLDNQPDTMKYISVKHLSVHSYISQSKDSKRPYYAANILDANPNTQWHSDFAVSVAGKEAYMTLKTDKPRYISGLDYAHLDSAKEPYGFMKNGIVYVSEDGENWQEAARFENVAQDDTLKHVSFSEPIYGQYVKLVIESYDNVFVAASTINVYEDVTKISPDEVNITYDKTTPTNGNVVARLESGSEITITNNNGSNVYIFTENGTFDFEYTDKNGERKTITAKVTWIDKEAPIGMIDYNIRDVTNEDVVATLTTNEKVTITNNGGSNKYTFTESGKFTFEFVDEAGNKGTETAEVTWINKNAPTGTISYHTTAPTRENVKAMIHLPKGVEVTNNGGSNEHVFTENGTFTFEFVDQAGNRGTMTATVTWIDRTPPKGAVSYSTTDSTNQNVVATLIGNEEIRVTNNNGSKEYTFEENGEFTFHFVDKAGNPNTFTAKVDWIDKIAPTAEVEYSITNPTNKNVVATLKNISSDATIINNHGSKEYTFEENGEFEFELRDKVGNTSKIKAKVTWIDRVAPKGTITYSTIDATNNDVVATIHFDEEVKIAKNTHTFKDNGEFTFEFEDLAGNKGTAIAKVSWIDKIAPTAQVKYNITEPTVEDVVATLVNESEEITIINNNGSKEYTFVENGEFTFLFVDKAGNKGSVTATVNNIKQTSVVSTITYSTTDLTKDDVVATITFSEENVRITNNDGLNTFVFKDNGEFTFRFLDAAGNKGVAKAKVNWIDKVVPTAQVKYSTTSATNKNVVVTLVNESEEIRVINNNGSKEYTFEENGEFTFLFEDKVGNKGTIITKVDWIDKLIPTAEVKYSITSATNKNVVATIVNESEEITIINNNGSKEYVFTDNGEFTFEFMDKAGNKGSVTAIVNNISKNAPRGKITYSTTKLTNQDVVATITFDEEVKIQRKTHTFSENGEFTFLFEDLAGNKGTAIAKVDWIDKVVPTARVKYSTLNVTNQNVIVSLIEPSENITITNNNGNDTYTFIKNGEFTFLFEDLAGNKGTITAKVDWIKKETDTNIQKPIEKPIISDKPVHLEKPNQNVTIEDNINKEEENPNIEKPDNEENQKPDSDFENQKPNDKPQESIKNPTNVEELVKENQEKYILAMLYILMGMLLSAIIICIFIRLKNLKK